MINIFLLDFYERLRAWHKFKEDLLHADIKTICTEVDKFWQRCPMSVHYLHPADVDTWPNPWNLLNDNNYCYYARGLGMVYTLLLLGIKDIDFVEGIDDNTDTVIVILVDNAKYVLNGNPDSVLNTDLTNFKITKRIDIDTLVKKIGK